MKLCHITIEYFLRSDFELIVADGIDENQIKEWLHGQTIGQLAARMTPQEKVREPYEINQIDIYEDELPELTSVGDLEDALMKHDGEVMTAKKFSDTMATNCLANMGLIADIEVRRKKRKKQ